MNTIPVYQGKLTVYLDQNILDMFVKFGLGEFGEMLAREYQVVYSDETLKEIKRSVGYESKFLDVLNLLGAFYLKVCLDENFQPTGKATITERDSYQSFNEYNSNEPVYESIYESIMLNVQKVYGGLNEHTFEDIKDSQNDAYDELHNFILKNIEDLKPHFPDLAVQLEAQADDMKQKLSDALTESARRASENVGDSIGWSGIKDLRQSLDIGPMQLNNIEPPNVIQQIWSLCLEKLPNEANITLEQFFGIESNPIYPSVEFFKYQKVNSIYNMLNMLGYFPDSKVHKERRFTAAISDQSHASFATFADMLLSRDKSFLKKVQAAYEFLGIDTNIFHVAENMHNKAFKSDS
ncbi:hypothetical protein CGI80_11605 [Vibrio parahaemolyticus]|uniref:hypothetical protein n=1 Tax=Vibrio parahaemolyticus TaxID=670 RepID=UPI00111EB729|nr:hypothetical protein [Vibrio parahaemolyticus]TOH50658.1 hypothetical protein CGI80_11605 [Vibrio parahaemolyticus]HCE2133934.1 hypothetical protein [Vibrio parahaemolyticus]